MIHKKICCKVEDQTKFDHINANTIASIRPLFRFVVEGLRLVLFLAVEAAKWEKY